jgi:hypothetical protein
LLLVVVVAVRAISVLLLEAVVLVVLQVVGLEFQHLCLVELEQVEQVRLQMQIMVRRLLFQV